MGKSHQRPLVGADLLMVEHDDIFLGKTEGAAKNNQGKSQHVLYGFHKGFLLQQYPVSCMPVSNPLRGQHKKD
jgi:hypothetical protein